MLYGAWPVWGGALRRMLQGRVSMDVPVALGIAAAFIPSAYATWVGRGEVYFDSVTMFVAFLLTARYLELCASQSVDTSRAHRFLEQFRVAVSVRANQLAFWFVVVQIALAFIVGARSEEHTSELQSLMRISYAVFCLKKNTTKYPK